MVSYTPPQGANSVKSSSVKRTRTQLMVPSVRLESLEGRLFLSATIQHYGIGEVPTDLATAFVAEGRIGRIGSATFEADIGPSTSAPFATADFGGQATHWQSGVSKSFILTVNADGDATFTLGGHTLNYGQAVFNGTDLLIRVRANNSTNTVVISNLVLDGNAIDGESATTSGQEGNQETLRISEAGLSDGFTLSGDATMTWVGEIPKNSNLAFQISAVATSVIGFGESTSSAAKSYVPYSGSFTVTRSGFLNESVTVEFTLEGDAVEGVDYQTIPEHSITFAPGETTKTITIVPTQTTNFDGTQFVELVLEAPQNNAGYTLAGQDVSSPVSIKDQITIKNRETGTDFTLPQTTLDQILAEMADESFAVREAATNNLVKLMLKNPEPFKLNIQGIAQLEALLLQPNLDPEVEQRIQLAIDRIRVFDNSLVYQVAVGQSVDIVVQLPTRQDGEFVLVRAYTKDPNIASPRPTPLAQAAADLEETITIDGKVVGTTIITVELILKDSDGKRVVTEIEYSIIVKP